MGRRFTAARRIGKLLLLDVDDGPVVGVRFGMTGSLLVDGVDPVGRLQYSSTRYDPAWDRWSVTFADGGRLVVHDPRRLGGVTLDPDVSHLGPDAASVSRRRAAPGAGRLVGAAQGPAARPVPGGRHRQPDRRRGAVAGRAVAPCGPASSLTPAELRRLHRHLGAHVGRPHRAGWLPPRRPHGRAARGRRVPEGRHATRAVDGRRTDHVVVPEPPGRLNPRSSAPTPGGRRHRPRSGVGRDRGPVPGRGWERRERPCRIFVGARPLRARTTRRGRHPVVVAAEHRQAGDRLQMRMDRVTGGTGEQPGPARRRPALDLTAQRSSWRGG